MKKFNLLLIASVLILFLSSGASASFTATADETDPMSPWDAVTAGATIGSPSWDGTNYYMAAPTTASMYKNFTTTQNYWAFDINSNNPGVIATTFIFRRDTTAANRCYLQFDSGVGTLTVQSFGLGDCAAITNINYPLVKDQWYTFHITDLGSSLKIDILNTTNTTVVKTSTFADVATTGTYIQVSLNQNAFKYDNFFVSTVSPSTSSSIAWGANEYVTGQVATFSWSVSDTDWATFDRYFIRLYKNGVLQDFGIFNLGCLCSTQFANPQTGSFTLSPQPGIYQVTLERATASSLWSLFETLSSDNTRILAQTSSYFNLNSTTFSIRQNVTATYHIGVGGLFPLIEWYYLDNGVEVRENRVVLTGLDGSINLTFSRVGTYNVYLKDGSVNGQVFQVKTITTTFAEGGIAQNNFANSNITLIPKNGTGGSGGTYHMTDLFDGNYLINGSVFNMGGVFYIDIFNRDANTETLRYFGNGISTVGVFDAGIFGLVINNKLDVGVEGYWMPGNNSARLMVQYPNGTIDDLANDTFFLSATDLSGYGLTVTPLKVIPKQPVTITVITPATGAYISIDGNSEGITSYHKTQNFSAGTTTIQWTFDKIGFYQVQLHDPSGFIHFGYNVEVAGVSATPTPVNVGGAGESNTVLFDNVDGWVRLLGSGLNNQARFLFSIIWIGIFLVGSFVIFKNRDAALVAGFLPFAFFSFLTVTVPTAGVEYIPKWTMILFILLIALAFRIFGR